MSFVHNSMFRSVKRSFPLFAVLLLTQVFFIAAVLSYTRVRLQEYSREDVRLRLDRYLQERSTGALAVAGSKGQGGGLHGLAFVRLISNNEQFLYAENHDRKINFEGVANLDPRSSAVWISLEDVTVRGTWTVASETLDNGLVVQAGMESLMVVELYGDLQRIMLAAIIGAIVVAGCLVLVCNRRIAAPLQEAEKAVARIVNKDSAELLHARNIPELTGLYDLLNLLIRQNSQLVKEMQDSLDNVAHDLRTPMTRLRSVAEYGLQQNSPEHLAGALSDCLEESERVLSMLGIMMTVAEAESGTMRLHKEAVSLPVTLRDIINLYEYVAEEKNIGIEIDVEEGISIVADRTRIAQVWANIIDNGIKYGREGGYIKIYSKGGPRTVSVFFEDNGMGISATELDRIWERLFRGDRSRTQQGLGLGLNYVRAVVEAHGGEVFVKSSLGNGSCFEVVLPVRQGELARDQIKEKSQTRGA